MSDIGGLQLLPSQPKKISFGLIVKNKSMLTAIVLFICLIISYVVGLLIQNSIAKLKGKITLKSPHTAKLS